MLIDDRKRYVENSHMNKKNQFEPLIEEDEMYNGDTQTPITQ